MDKDVITIQWMDRIIEAIDAFRWSGVPDDVIVKRIYHLCKFERQQAQNNIDAALDALEERMKNEGFSCV